MTQTVWVCHTLIYFNFLVCFKVYHGVFLLLIHIKYPLKKTFWWVKKGPKCCVFIDEIAFGESFWNQQNQGCKIFMLFFDTAPWTFKTSYFSSSWISFLGTQVCLHESSTEDFGLYKISRVHWNSLG